MVMIRETWTSIPFRGVGVGELFQSLKATETEINFELMVLFVLTTDLTSSSTSLNQFIS